MPWGKLDDGYARHPKLAAAGPLAMALDVAGICYANEYLTDGFVPAGIVPMLLNLSGVLLDVDPMGADKPERLGRQATPRDLVDRLVGIGRWEPTDGGFAIHDFGAYNKSRSEVLAERAANATRQALFQQRKRGDNSGSNALVTTEKRGDNRDLTSTPVPVPDPRTVVPSSTEVTSANADDARALFERFREKILPGARLLPAGRKKISTRLEKWTMDQLRTAIDHFAADEWQMAHNAGRGAAWFFHSDERIEAYVNLGPAAAPAARQPLLVVRPAPTGPRRLVGMRGRGPAPAEPVGGELEKAVLRIAESRTAGPVLVRAVENDEFRPSEAELQNAREVFA